MEYTFIEKNDLNGSGETKMCPAPVACPQISYKEFLEECKRTMRMSEAEVDGALRAVADRLIFYMDMGHSVKLDPLGTFTPKLAMKKGVSTPSKDDIKKRHNTENVVLKSPHFHASAEWMEDLKERAHLKYCGEDRNLRVIKTTAEERLNKALEFLETHQEMRVIDYMRMTKLAKTTACRELRSFCIGPDAKLDRIGNANQLRYIKRE